MVDLEKIKDLSEWRKKRSAVQADILGVLGPLAAEHAELQVNLIDETDFPTFTRQRVNYFVDEWTRVSAWLFLPDGKESKDEYPAILCCHRMVPQGKDETAGLEGDKLLHFAEHYAELGYVTLAPDCVTAGERVSIGLEPYDTSVFYQDYPNLSVQGKMLIDHVHAIDVLSEHRRVDPSRIGVIGHGLGAQNALFLGAFDERVQACVAICGFTRFHDDDDPGRWARPNGFIHLPKLREAVKKGAFPFDWEHVLALMAPIPALIIAALNDAVYPKGKSCAKAARLASRIYKFLGAANALGFYEHHGGHTMTREALLEADAWFERWL